MSATTTQLLSSGEFCKLRYDIIPVKSASANVFFYTDNTLVASERYTELSEIKHKMTHFFN
jgi:hypothetical protein